MKASNSFRKRLKKKNLIQTYEDKISGSSAIGIDKVNANNFEKNLSDNIEIIKRKTKNDTYKFTVYKQKLISKGADSKPRVISIPTFRDRLTLRCMCDMLFDIYSKDIQIDIPQIKIHKIQSEIDGRVYDGYVKIDVKSFYNSIDHSRLKTILQSRIKKPKILNLINKAITNGTVSSPKKGYKYMNSIGIPQGLSISNILAEIFMLEFDIEMNKQIKFSYSRYVDDILILCDKDTAKEIGNMVIEQLDAIGLQAHPLVENSKSEYGDLSNEFSFLGYLFSDYKTTVGISNRQRFESSVVKILTTYKYREEQEKVRGSKKNLEILEWRLNLRITGCIFNDSKRGWIFYFSQITDLTILHQLDYTIEKMLERFNLKGKVNLKTLVKTYHEAKRTDVAKSTYIINFDTLDKAGKINILKKYLGTKYKLTGKSDEEIDRLFRMRISRVVKELEEDLQDFS